MVVSRTLRETFGVGLSDLGDGLTWGEARDLLRAAADDQSTAFGAELAGWAYPASMPMLLSIAAQVQNERAVRRVMPWAISGSGPRASEAEVARAQQELENEIIIG